MTNILKPITKPYPPDIEAILNNYPQQDGYLLKLFRVFGNSLRFLSKGVANLLDKDSPLPIRQRELIILRTCVNNNCEYEWGVHVTIFGKMANLSAKEIAATCDKNINSQGWSETESLLLRVIDELCHTGRVAKSTYLHVQNHWSVEQQLEVLALCGNYHTICFVANTASLEGESFGARFPQTMEQE